MHPRGMAPLVPLHLCIREHIEGAGLLWLATEIFADIAPHIRLADLRSLPEH